MRGVVKNYQPNITITLFNSKIHKTCRGVLIFPEQIKEKRIIDKLKEKLTDFWEQAASLQFKGDFAYFKSLENFKRYLSHFRWNQLAIFFLLIAFFSMFITLSPVFFGQAASYFTKYTPAKTVENTDKTGFGNLIRKKDEAPFPTPDPTPSSYEFTLSIPKINLSSDVAPNVNLASEEVYRQKLRENGVAHALGSYFPGENGPVYLFAHSTDTLANIPLFNAKFFSLTALEPGDLIDISYHGRKYKYMVNEKRIIDPMDLDAIRQTSSSLILQTCWPPGTDWQRLVIFASPS